MDIYIYIKKFGLKTKENTDNEEKINKIKGILFRWFPIGAKFIYNNYKFRPLSMCSYVDFYSDFFILYKNKCYHYMCIIYRNNYKNNEVRIKLVDIFLIINNGYKHIGYNFDPTPKILIMKSMGSQKTYQKTSPKTSPKIYKPIYLKSRNGEYYYKNRNLMKKIIIGNNNIMYYKQDDYDVCNNYTDPIFIFNYDYDYKKNIIIITKDRKSRDYNENYIGLFRNVLLFLYEKKPKMI